MSTSRITFNSPADRIASRVRKMRSSAVRDLFAAASRPDIISLSGGMPDVSLIPEESLRIAVEAAVSTKKSASLQYGSTDGREDTRRVCCMIMEKQGIYSKPDEVLITTGAQEALDLIAKAFIDPGDIIVAEGPTYLGALQAFSAYEPDIRCIPFDQNGMRMDLLEEELARIGKGNVRFLYTIPNFQNPGGVTLSKERRTRLLELSYEYEFVIVEDDPYGRLRFEGEPIETLKSIDDSVIYLGTISKILAPGLRTGWIAAPKKVLSYINLVKQGTDLCGSSFDQVVVEHYFTDTPWEETLSKFISTYHTRRDAMLAALDKHFPPEATWTHPEGGFFIWATLPPYVDTGSMLATALEQGVTYTPGDGFYPNGLGGQNSMRLAFCFEDPERLEEAIRRLGHVIDEQLELYRAFIEAGAIKPQRASESSTSNTGAHS